MPSEKVTVTAAFSNEDIADRANEVTVSQSELKIAGVVSGDVAMQKMAAEIAADPSILADAAFTSHVNKVTIEPHPKENIQDDH